MGGGESFRKPIMKAGRLQGSRDKVEKLKTPLGNVGRKNLITQDRGRVCRRALKKKERGTVGGVRKGGRSLRTYK